MVRLTTFKDLVWEFYKLHAERGHVVDATEAGNNAIVLTGVEAHAVAEVTGGDVEYTRTYIDNVMTDILSATFAVADTTVAFTSLIEGETVDIYIPIASGKLTRTRKQIARAWNVEEVTVPLLEGGSEREEDLEVDLTGVATMQLHHKGNQAMADFETARDGESNGDTIYLLIDVVNSTEAAEKHVLLHEAEVVACGKTSAARSGIAGVLTDSVELTFQPDVVLL